MYRHTIITTTITATCTITTNNNSAAAQTINRCQIAGAVTARVMTNRPPDKIQLDLGPYTSR